MSSLPAGSWGKGLMSVWAEAWWHVDVLHLVSRLSVWPASSPNLAVFLRVV